MDLEEHNGPPRPPRGGKYLDINQILTRSSDGSVSVLVEIPKDNKNKYEYYEDLGMIVLDRTLHSSVHYPTDYGFVPGTSGADSEPLDAMVMVDQSTVPGCLVEARIVGVLSSESNNVRPEQKLLGVPVREPRFAEYEDVSDVPGHLESSDIGVLGWEGPKSCSKRPSGCERRAKKSPPRLPPEPKPWWAAVTGQRCTGILFVEKSSSRGLVLLFSCPPNIAKGGTQMETNFSLRWRRAVLGFGVSHA